MKVNFKRFIPVFYWVIIIALLALFFTNDFGLSDIRKTSIIVAVGIDTDGEEVQVTAQVAVPQPSQEGGNVQYVGVQGSGLTIADALNEINVKTGFYPKLLFCKLILIGEECQSEELFRLLGCFYRRNYSELTALVAMCKGRAQDMLAMPATIDPENSTAIQKVLSEELKKSANVSTANLKSIAESNYSVSQACYMPFIEANVEGTSMSGGNGDNVGGEQGGGQSGQGSGQGGQGSQGGQMEFTARKTAVFSYGKFAGILDEQQSFALNILKNDLNLVVVPCDTDELHYTLGLKNAGGGVELKVNEGVPELTLSFKARAQIQGARVVLQPQKVRDDVVSPEVLQAAEDEVKARMDGLVRLCIEQNCDVLGVRELLHKKHYKYYEAFKDDVLSRMKVNYKIEIQSLN